MIDIVDLGLGGVKLFTFQLFTDQRGFFFESYSKRAFDSAVGSEVNFVQDNHSRSECNVLRGLHFQRKHPQGKLVRVVSGEVFDVAVDLRRTAATFGQWVGIKLSASKPQMLWIPPYCAHGFVVLSRYADLLYKATDYYCPDCEQCLRWDDPEVAIAWPSAAPPILSSKDRKGRLLSDLELFS